MRPGIWGGLPAQMPPCPVHCRSLMQRLLRSAPFPALSATAQAAPGASAQSICSIKHAPTHTHPQLLDSTHTHLQHYPTPHRRTTPHPHKGSLVPWWAYQPHIAQPPLVKARLHAQTHTTTPNPTCTHAPPSHAPTTLSVARCESLRMARVEAPPRAPHPTPPARTRPHPTHPPRSVWPGGTAWGRPG